MKPQAIFGARSQMAGRYQLTVRNTEGHITRQTPWFDNLITDNGLDLIFTSPFAAFGIKTFNNGCFVGTGSATPAVTDSSLQAYLASGGEYSRTAPATVVGPPLYWKCAVTYRFATGVAAGNISEVAVGASPTNIFSRALIEDAFGNPTTITVLADEVLDVTYELRVYPPVTDDIAPFVLNGVTISVTGRGSVLNSPRDIYQSIQQNTASRNLPGIVPYHSGSILGDVYTGAGSDAGAYGGGGGFADGSYHVPYVVGDYSLTIGAHFSFSKANGQNQLWSLGWPQGGYIFRLSTPAIKTNVQEMDILYRISWGRYP